VGEGARGSERLNGAGAPASQPRALGGETLDGSMGFVSLFAHKNHSRKKDATMLKRSPATPMPDTPESSLLPALNAFPTVLNSGWRVMDDPLQWLLQRKQGSRWRNRSFCRTREGLLRCVNDHCGIVDLEALNRLEALPDFHC